jgi:methyl-accepting chemotaxis protein
LDTEGRPYKVVKYVLDITLQKEQEIILQELLQEKTQQEEEVRQQMEEIITINDELSALQAELQSQLNAINRSNAVIEFDLDGHILDANENFLKTVGYAKKEEVLGKHHRIFMFPEEAETDAYQKFWQTLGAGNYVAGVFRRKAKDGAERWIMGSYNPLYDKNGKVYKLVKYVYDVTLQKKQEIELQRALEDKQAHEEELRQSMEELATINNELTLKTQTIEQLHQELKSNYAQLEAAKAKIEERMRNTQSEIEESIVYAQRIQRAVSGTRAA